MLFSTHPDKITRENQKMDKKIEKKLRALFRRNRVLNLEKIMWVVDQRSTRTTFRKAIAAAKLMRG